LLLLLLGGDQSFKKRLKGKGFSRVVTDIKFKLIRKFRPVKGYKIAP